MMNRMFFDPDRIESPGFYLVCREDKNNCPAKVRRCEQCKRQFGKTDRILVKTTGEREHVNKKGNVVHQVANVYLHYLTNCLVKFDTSFKFENIRILKDTQNLLSKRQLERLLIKGCKLC